MKSKTHFLNLILTVAILHLTVSSCTDYSAQVRPVLAAADSLQTIDHYSALETLLSIDSLTATRLSGELRADYALLLAETEYKCYEPLADNEEKIIRHSEPGHDYYVRDFHLTSSTCHPKIIIK